VDATTFSVDQIFRLMPDVAELAPLRAAVLRASTVDASIRWSGSLKYATFDRRVLVPEHVEAALREAEARGIKRIRRMHRRFGHVLAAVLRGEEESAVAQLLALAELSEASEQPQDALVCYTVAADLASRLLARGPLILAQRRKARVFMSIGEMEAAADMYERSWDEAVAADDITGEVIALTGLGNLSSLLGRWARARGHYERGLFRAGAELPRERAQLHINLSMVARETGDYTQADAWLNSSLALWDQLTPADHSVWYNNHGLLNMAIGDAAGAEAAFSKALEVAPSAFDSAMILDNLAELALRKGQFAAAEAVGRRAEEQAIATGSPLALAEIYIRLGKIFRVQGDSNGLTFFEKALELSKDRYPLTQANAHFEYGVFRRIVGDPDEARGHIEQALLLFEEMGGMPQIAEAKAELARIKSTADADRGVESTN
jgi:tetratricopeptide (TPR) repeat protein